MDKKIVSVLVLTLLFAGLAAAGDLKAMSVSYEPAPASPGSVITVWVQVKNDSIYEVEEGTIRLEPSYPLSLRSGETAEKTLGLVGAYKTLTVEYKLMVDASAVDGEHGIKVTVGEGPSKREEDFMISVLSRTPKLEIVDSSANELVPGSVTPVMLSIKNVGGSIAKDIVIKVNPERTVTSTGVVVEREIVSLGAVSNYVAKLDKGETASVELMLAVNQDASLKNYSVPVTMEYYDVNGTSKSETGYLGIKVNADADVDAVINSITPNAFPGGTSEITVDLFNIGLADARYVVVELEGANAAISEPRQFIGTLEADDFDSFNTSVTFDAGTPVGQNSLTLKIRYKDEELEEQVVTKQLQFEVLGAGQAAGAADPLGGVLGLIGLVLQLVGLYVVAKWAWPKAKGLLGKGKK
jgi:hypothetical protein